MSQYSKSSRLLDLPWELRRPIIVQVLRRGRKREPPFNRKLIESRVRLRNCFDDNFPKTTNLYVQRHKNRHLHGNALRTTNRQLRYETNLLIEEEIKSGNIEIPFVLVVMIVKDVGVFPTWMSFPYRPEHLKMLTINLRIVRPGTSVVPDEWIKVARYEEKEYSRRDKSPANWNIIMAVALLLAIKRIILDHRNQSPKSPSSLYGRIGGGGGGHPGNGPSPLRRLHVDNHQEGQDEEAAGQEDQNTSSKLQKRCGRTGARFYGIPKGKDSYAVPNPKDAINKVMPQMLDLQIHLAAREAQMAIGDFNGSASDVGQALSLPVFMMAESIEQIKEAKETGQTIKNQKDLEFFEKMLGVIFMFLPFLDALSPELLLFEGMATGLAFLGNTALAIQDIVEHPENAFMDVLGIIMDGAFIKTGKGYKTAADARRGMSSDLIKKSGKTIEPLDGKLQDVLGKACAK